MANAADTDWQIIHEFNSCTSWRTPSAGPPPHLLLSFSPPYPPSPSSFCFIPPVHPNPLMSMSLPLTQVGEVCTLREPRGERNPFSIVLLLFPFLTLFFSVFFHLFCFTLPLAWPSDKVCFITSNPQTWQSSPHSEKKGEIVSVLVNY